MAAVRGPTAEEWADFQEQARQGKVQTIVWHQFGMPYESVKWDALPWFRWLRTRYDGLYRTVGRLVRYGISPGDGEGMNLAQAFAEGRVIVGPVDRG
jgi:hypothetical protein